MLDHREIVRDEQIGQALLLLQVHHQIEHLRLDRHVERRDRLVARRSASDSAPARARCRRAGAGRRKIRAGSCASAPGAGRRARTARQPAAWRSAARPRPCTLIGSATMSPADMRGLSEENGSWKTICISRRYGPQLRLAQMRDVAAAERDRCRPSARSAAAPCAPTVDLPQPDSPTRPSVSPAAIVKLRRRRPAPARRCGAGGRASPGNAFEVADVDDRRFSHRPPPPHSSPGASTRPNGAAASRARTETPPRQRSSAKRAARREAQPAGRSIERRHRAGNFLQARRR